MSDETTGPSPEEMGLTPDDLKTENEQSGNPKETSDKLDSEKIETNPEKGVEIPTYNPDDQIKLKEGDDYLSVVGTEKLRMGRELATAIRDYYKDQGKTGINEISPKFRHYGGQGLNWAVDNTEVEVGKHFSAHGIAKSPVQNLDHLLTQGVDINQTLYSMPYIHSVKMQGALGAEMPKLEGGIIVISDYDKGFPEESDPQIKYILVDEQYMRVVGIMQERYAKYDAKVVPWHDVPRVLTEDYNSHNPGNEIKLPVAPDSESPLRYEFGKPPPGLEKSGLVDTVQAASSDEIDPEDMVW